MSHVTDHTAEPFSLYVHIPYCISKCPYCDFNSHVAARIPEEEYTQALLRELRHYSESEAWAGRSVKTVFFGGGTPSTFEGNSIGAVLDEAAKLFGFDERVEITLEANPGAVDAGRFRDYRRCGVNRISIGAQSFDAELLRFLGRVHSAEETRQALKSVRKAGFENYSLDLIYGIPGQTVDGVSRDLSEALEHEPPHLSAYNLTIEEGTPFHARYRQGLLKPLDEEVEIEMAAPHPEHAGGRRPGALRDLQLRPARAWSPATTSTTGRAATTSASAPAPTVTIASRTTPWASAGRTSGCRQATCASRARPATPSPSASAPSCGRPWRNACSPGCG